ncbi:MAG TPA: hypothetical protein VF699_13625 [Caulobacteraceae bacterium]|jgi:hypothetical protein
MSDRVFFSIMIALAAGLVALALVWPQGFGARSPGPFGEPLAQPPPAKPSEVPIQ